MFVVCLKLIHNFYRRRLYMSMKCEDVLVKIADMRKTPDEELVICVTTDDMEVFMGKCVADGNDIALENALWIGVNGMDPMKKKQCFPHKNIHDFSKVSSMELLEMIHKMFK